MHRTLYTAVQGGLGRARRKSDELRTPSQGTLNLALDTSTYLHVCTFDVYEIKAIIYNPKHTQLQ